MISLDYDDKEDILQISVVGGVNNEEISAGLKQIAESFKHKKQLFVLADYSRGWIEADPGFFLVNLNAITEVFVQYFAPFEQYYNAYIIDPEDKNATEVLIRQFIKLIGNVDSFHYEFFRSQDQAYNWIKSMQSQ